MRLDCDWLSRPESRAVLDALAGDGHRALFVGGCVRNALLEEPVSDIDIATDARPDRVMDLTVRAGLKSIPTGIDYGTVTVVSDGIPYEVTTFRKDIETFGRRAVIAFSSDIADDARRRDFTMNALYAEPDGTLIDPLDGLADLRRRRVRFIEHADARIREDYLRILRFFRFHAWYGDQANGLDSDGFTACGVNLDGLETLSKERVGKEMMKLLAAPDPSLTLAGMVSSGCLQQILPGSTSEALPALVELEARVGATPNPIRRLAVIGGEELTENLCLSKAISRDLGLIRILVEKATAPSELAYRFGRNMAHDVVLARSALLAVPLPPDLEAELDKGTLVRFPVRARDLSGICSGPELGRRLRSLEAAWIASGYILDRSSLLDLPD